MSLNTYTFPAVYTTSNAEGGTNNGIKTYRDSGDNIWNFAGSTHEDINLQVHPQEDPYTRPLIVTLQTFNNGLREQLRYFTHITASGYAVNGEIYIVDEQGNEIDDFSYAGQTFHNGNTITFDVPVPIGMTLPQNPIRFIPSVIEYDDDDMGDPANVIYPYGGLIVNRSPLFNKLSDLTGEFVADGNKFRMNLVTMGRCYNDDQLDALENGIIEAGDGNDPFRDPMDPSNNPFENHTSGTGGGKGKYEKQGDKTGKPELPSSAVLSSGFIAMYAPSAADLQSLGAKLWSDDFFDNFLKLWNDPMEAIISLGLVPFTPVSSGQTNCVIGNYDTEISMPRVTAQYQTFSCGSVMIPEYWGSALDYSPYCEAEIFLPFCGMKKLDIDDIMGKTVSVDYNVDLLGGEAVCYVTVDDVVLYDYRCNLQTSIPISSSSYAGLYSNIIKGVSGMAIGGAIGSATGAAAGAITSAVNVITSKHSSIERGSELSPNAGVLGLLTPYIILHRVVQSLPSGFNDFKGYPSNVTRTLGSCSGYTEVEYIHLDNINATEEEKNELLSILHEGIMI